jgi:hypothetical protein
LACPVLSEKIFLFLPKPNHRHILGHPVPLEGRIAIVTDAGRGAVDVAVSLTNGTKADGKAVWS